MKKEEFALIFGILLIIFLAILTFIFKGTDNTGVSSIIFIGSILGGIFFVYILMVTKVKWASIVSKVFFIIPLLVAVGLLIFWGALMAYDVSRNSFTGYLEFTLGVFLWGSIIFVYILEIILFIKMDKNKNPILKVIAGIIGISTYFIVGVIGAAIVSPPSFGTYGTPLYRPKRE